MDVKYSLLDKIENIKQDIKSQEYKEILELIAKIRDTKRIKYDLGILIISPTINDEDGYTILTEIEREDFEIYLTPNSYERLETRIGMNFNLPTRTRLKDEEDNQNLKNIYEALRCQSTQVKEEDNNTFFIEKRYILINITKSPN